MDLHPYSGKACWKFPAIVICALCMMMSSSLFGQMESIVNSLADDEFAHPWDNPATTEIDESIDGICGDEQGRCTLRAALEEASFIGQAAYVGVTELGVIFLDSTQGPFYPPDNSIVQGFNHYTAIVGRATSTIFVVGNNTLISGFVLQNSLIGILVAGNDNRIGLDTLPHANIITGMYQNGIIITGDNNRVTGNLIGATIFPIPEPGNLFGVFVTGRNNIIGGIGKGEGNVISHNDIGIGLYTLEESTIIVGNHIGTDITGTQAFGNRVGIDNIGPNVIIGSNDLTGRNVISGNTESGILMGVESANNIIINNHIGTDITGTVGIPNRDGITLGPGSTNVHVKNNLIAHNTSNGILLSGIGFPVESRDHTIEGNEIRNNGNVGILFSGTSNNNIVGSSLTDDLEPNDIFFNGSAGIMFIGGIVGDPEMNTIRKNRFEDNTGIGIRIFGGQGAILAPVITSFHDDGNAGVVTGTHSSVGAVIDVYAGDRNSSGVYEGLQHFAQGVVDGNGEFEINALSCHCDTIVATATDPAGNTSEFSDGFGNMITALDDHDLVFDHLSVFPNPADQYVTFRFSLKASQFVSLKIFNPAGGELATLLNDHLLAGEYGFTWPSEEMLPGMYYYRLTGKDGNAGGVIIKGR